MTFSQYGFSPSLHPQWDSDVWPLCCGGDGVHHLHDAVQGGVGANGHVSAAEVIVDGADHANNIQVGRFLGFFVRNITWKTLNIYKLICCIISRNLLMIIEVSLKNMFIILGLLSPVCNN